MLRWLSSCVDKVMHLVPTVTRLGPDPAVTPASGSRVNSTQHRSDASRTRARALRAAYRR